MMNFLCGGLFSAMWNNFYNAIVRNVSPGTKGAIICIGAIIAVLCIIAAFKKGDEKKPIKNWFAFWVGLVVVVLLIVYTILCSL